MEVIKRKYHVAFVPRHLESYVIQRILVSVYLVFDIFFYHTRH